MPTTITVKERTRRKLQELKERKGSPSYDRLLEDLADRELKLRDSLFGKTKGLSKNYEREHEDRS